MQTEGIVFWAAWSQTACTRTAIAHERKTGYVECLARVITEARVIQNAVYPDIDDQPQQSDADCPIFDLIASFFIWFKLTFGADIRQCAHRKDEQNG